MISQYSPIPAIPKPFGPHTVGTTEWEIPVSEILSSSPSPEGEANITTVKFRLFYPTTCKAKSKSSASWLPSPQREWSQAYASFLGASPRLSSIISLVPTLLHMTNMPCVVDSPLLQKDGSSKYPLVVFSHGLGGNFNAYSSICIALASFGIVCAAPEHRDGSAPTSIIRAADGRKANTIPYQRHPHAPTAKVLNARNAQLRVRLWELERLFAVLKGLDEGKIFSNYALAGANAKSGLELKNVLDLRSGHVTWAGHSFGACTQVQFLKSIYYRECLPSLKNTEFENELDRRPLLKAIENGDLVQQITPDSPLILLDLWAMPLRAGLTRWLWEKPLPCYDRKLENGDPAPPTNVVAIISAEFQKYTELLNRMKAALSSSPAEAIYNLEKRASAERADRKPPSRPHSQLLATPVNKMPSNVEKPTEVESPSEGEDNRDEDQEPDAGDELFVTPFATPSHEFPFEKITMNRRSSFPTWDFEDVKPSQQEETPREKEEAADSMEEAVDQIREMQLDEPTTTDAEEDAEEEYMRLAMRKPLPAEKHRAKGASVRFELDSTDAEPEKKSKPVPPSQPTSRPSLLKASEHMTNSDSSLSTIASSNPVSRTPSPTPSTSTCESTSIVSTRASSVEPTPDAINQSTDQETKTATSTGTTNSSFSPTFSNFTLPPHSLPRTRSTHASNSPSPLDPHLYLIPHTAHLSQSDFGVLFPKLVRFLMNAENPVETIRLNVRAMLAVMRGVGLDFEGYKEDVGAGKGDGVEDDVDQILTDKCREERWVRLDLY